MEKFNKNQLKVIKTIDSPLLVIAGPGSGKTRTLVERVIYLLNEKKIKGENILLGTFTEKASKELITRISMKINKNIDISEMYIGTIHSICLRIIDENIEYSHLRRNYKILDELEQKFFIYKKMKKFIEIEGSSNFFLFMERYKFWDRAVELKKWLDRINEEDIHIEKDIGNERVKYLKKVNEIYKELLFQENVIDFSNIQFECYRILLENKIILEKMRKKINYIMIDEYQDTNLIQEKIFLLIARGEKNNICVVGDDDQGIYRFRGATVKNILRFDKNFNKGECQKIELNINYRSNKDIVNFCINWNNSLNWNGWRYKKELISGKKIKNKTLGAVKISVETSENEWKEKIYKFIKNLKSTKKIENFNQIAFLFRSVRNKKVVRLMQHLEKKGIRVYSPRSNMFFSRDEIKFCIGLFLCIFYQSKIFLKNSYYRECFDNVLKKLSIDEELKECIKILRNKTKNLNENLGNFYKLIYSFIGYKSFIEYLDFKESHVLKNRATYNISIFFKLINKFDEICSLKEINSKNIEQVVNYFFGKHLFYLRNTGISEYEDINEYAPSNAISFLTFHQSKGLEFPIVIVGSLESAPKLIMNENQEKLELEIMEEFEPRDRIKEFDFWRVYYTAFSRAQNLLALTCIEHPKIPTPDFAFQKVYKGLKDISQEEFEISKFNVEKSKKMYMKEKLSFTTNISLYDSCPRLYKLINEYKFSEIKSKSIILGELIHTFLEDINKGKLKGEKLEKDILRKKYMDFYNSLSKKYNIEIEKKHLEEGFSSINDYICNYLNIFESIIEVEKKVILIEDNYLIEGVIDLVTEKNGKLEIIDFKTGKSKEERNNYEEQIRIYIYLLEKKYFKKISRGLIFYINERRDKKIVEVDISEEKIMEAVNKFKKIGWKIINKDFETGYLDKKKCSFCSFRNYCKNYL